MASKRNRAEMARQAEQIAKRMPPPKTTKWNGGTYYQSDGKHLYNLDKMDPEQKFETDLDTGTVTLRSKKLGDKSYPGFLGGPDELPPKEQPREPDSDSGWETVEAGSGDGWETVQEGDAASEATLPDKPKEAFLQGWGQAGTFGYLPHLQAMTEPLTDRLGNLVTGAGVEPAPLSQSLPGTQEYISARDRNIEEGKKLQESNPYAYGSGAVTESILEAPATLSLMGGKTAAKALGKIPLIGKYAAGPVGRGVLSATEQGALYNPGDKPGEMGGLQWDERAHNAVDAAKTGLLVAGGTKGLQKGIDATSKIPAAMKKTSDNLARRAAGYMLRDRRRIGNRAGEIADQIYEDNLLPIGGATEEIAQNASRKVEESKQKLDKAYEAVDAAKEGIKSGDLKVNGVKPRDLRGFHPKKQMGEIEERLRDRLKNEPKAEKAIGEVMDWLKTIAADNKKGMLPSAAREIKSMADKQFNYAKSTGKRPALQRAYKEVADFIREKLDGQAKVADKVLDKSASKTLQKENKRIRNLIDIRDTAQDKVLRNEVNLPGGMMSHLTALAAPVAAGGVATGSTIASDPENWSEDMVAKILFGGLAGAGYAGARKYGPGLLGRGYRSGSKALSPLRPLLKPAAKANPQGLIRSGTKGLITIEDDEK